MKPPRCPRWMSRFRNALLPLICSYCGQPVQENTFPYGICHICLSNMPLRPPGRTRHFLSADDGHEVSDALPFYCFFYYKGPLRRAVTGLKFHDRVDFAKGLADLMLLAWQRQLREEALSGRELLGRIEAIIPLPLHAKRLRERGYNQAELLSKPLAEGLGLAFRPEALIRARYTRRQSETSDRSERLRNVEGAFVCPAPETVRGRCVALFDDVSSSGASLMAGALALLRAGAEVIVIAMASNHREENSSVEDDRDSL